MLTFLAPFLSFLGGPVINGLIGAYKAKLDSVNTQDAHAIDLAKADLLAQIEARKQATILAAIPSASLVQRLFAWPVVLYVWKLIVYDKIFAPWFGWSHGSTDPLDGWIGIVATTIVSFYMGGQIVSGVISTVARRFGK